MLCDVRKFLLEKSTEQRKRSVEQRDIHRKEVLHLIFTHKLDKCPESVL